MTEVRSSTQRILVVQNVETAEFNIFSVRTSFYTSTDCRWVFLLHTVYTHAKYLFRSDFFLVAQSVMANLEQRTEPQITYSTLHINQIL